MAIQQPFTTTSPLVFNIDYFDWVRGAGYKKYYLAGLCTTTGNKEYILTSDGNLVADSANMSIGGNGFEEDFDITFNSPVTVAAADAMINYTSYMSSGAGDHFNLTIIIYHVRGATETQIGTVTSDSDDGSTPIYRSKAAKMALTKKHFAAGDKMRVTIQISSSQVSTTQLAYIDPAGSISHTGQWGSTVNSSFSINLPFEIQ